MKKTTLSITLLFTFLFTCTIFAQSKAGVEKQNVYKSSDGATAKWVAYNKHNKPITIKVKITRKGCDVKSKSQIKEIYVNANDEKFIKFNRATCWGYGKGYKYYTVSVISKKFN